MELKDSDLVYAKPNLVIEPLVDNWYAWPHLISPATAALNIKNRHLMIMDSYIKNPKVHAAAVKNPKMRGGPFIDYDGKRVEEIIELRNNSLDKCSDLLVLCENISLLNKLLDSEASETLLRPFNGFFILYKLGKSSLTWFQNSGSNNFALPIIAASSINSEI